MGSTTRYGDAEADAQLRAGLSDWCVREAGSPRARADCRFMHCLPVRRNVAVADEVLDGPRSVVKQQAHNRMRGTDGSAAPNVEGHSSGSAESAHDHDRPDQTVAVRALRNAAPYIRMYKGKIFVIKAGGAVFGDLESTRGSDRAGGDPAPGGHQASCWCTAVGRSSPSSPNALGIETRMVQGRRITDEKSIDVTTMVLNGLINTRILAICRELDIDAVGISGVDAGLVRAHRRPPVKLEGDNPRDRSTTASWATSMRSMPRCCASSSTTA